MRNIERFELIDRIGRELQSRMSYSDIDAFLPSFGVDTSKSTSSVNSKWVYVKELLSDEPSETIVKIADELEMDHPYVLTAANELTESHFWDSGHFRLFLSHLSSFKENAGRLRTALMKYGISTFVAHVDIEPTRKWQDEIEAALFSMDALAAVLMPGFKESNWTDQEIGVAIGRGIPVVPLIRGLDPYGFIGKYQGLYTSGKSVKEVARSLFYTLVSSQFTRSRMLSCLIDTTVLAKSPDEVACRLETISDLVHIPTSHLERLREVAFGIPYIEEDEKLRSSLNALLTQHDLEPIIEVDSTSVVNLNSPDDLPF